MTPQRTLANAIFVMLFALVCIGGIQFLAVNMGQQAPFSGSYTVHAVFPDADGLPTAADVRVFGVDVGKVTQIAHDPQYPGETVATLQISDAHVTPVYSNGFAVVRPKTLLGERYVDLTVGGGTGGEAIESGGYLPIGQAGKDVSNDEIFNSFDATARAEQQQVLKDLDAATFGRGGDIQAVLPQLSRVVSDLQPLANLYEKDQPQVDDIFVQLNTMMQTLADEHEQLGGLLHNGSIALAAIAQRDQALIGTLQNAATFATEINTALTPTIAAQRRAINELGPALDAQNELLNQIVAPQSVCGGKPCGIDRLFLGTMLGNVNYPNNQLTVTSTSGELVADEWDAMFSQPTSDHRALSYTNSLHSCPIAPFDSQACE